MPAAKDSNLQQKVLSFIRKNNLVSGRKKLAVAVSGGPDSVCLLHILAGLRKELNIKLHVVHLNHQLRGDESDTDAEYVADLARRLKIPATIGSRDVQFYQAKRRISLEEAARDVRYAFLAEVARKIGAEKAAVGHTADDQSETVLMHLIRGSGIKGLRGLLPVSKWQSLGAKLTIIRPLLEISRSDTIAYCQQHNLQPRTDSSNLSTEPFRNRVRHRLLPELKKYNPQIKDALLRASRTAAADLDFIEAEARRCFSKIAKIEKGLVAIDKKKFLTLHPSLKRQILRFSVESLLGNLKDIESGHIEDIMEALEKPAGKVIGLPFGLNFTIEYKQYVLAPDTVSLCPLPTLEKEFMLNIPGKTSVSGWNIEASIVRPSTAVTDGEEAEGLTAYFDAGAVGKKLAVRHRLPGDRFQPLGMAQAKKLNRFMIDAKIPQAWRLRVPIVCSSSRVVWVVGWRIDERYRVTPDTKRALRLEFKPV